jgi:hypothetical protein
MQGSEIPPYTRADEMTGERKFAILVAATILAARKLLDSDPNKPNMAKGFFVDRAIEDAGFILERIEDCASKEFTQTVRMLHDIHEADASSACVMVVPICNLTRKPSHMLVDCLP